MYAGPVLEETVGLKIGDLDPKNTCDYRQVYLFSRPGAKDEEIFLQRRLSPVREKKEFRQTDRAMAEKLLKAGFKKFVFAVVDVYGPGKETEEVLWIAEECPSG